MTALIRTQDRRTLFTNVVTVTLLLLCLPLVAVSQSSTVATTNSRLRSNNNNNNNHNQDDTSWERIPLLRRLYGNHSVSVRNEIAAMEERMERYQTGLPGDPNHLVPYENHPYDKTTTSRRRHLQAGNNATDQDLFEPIRISFYTEALDSIRDGINDAKIDWYEKVILPETAEFWTRALAVVPVAGALKMSATELDNGQFCGGSSFTKVPSEHVNNGVLDTDLLLYVSGSNDARYCPERTLAVAVPCNFDQFDRPTAGAINVCLDNIILDESGDASPGVVEDYIDVTIHEIAHVLGHSSNSYRFFWDPSTGEPRTPRPFQSRTVTCVNGAERTLILPADNTMKFVNDNGRRYASIVTEKVRAIARNQFDCQSLDGAQLENQPTREESCTGDHWDERLYYPEALSGIISPTANIISSLTLALMEDSGWYRANYTVTKMSPWGLGQGCEFAKDPCLIPDSGGGAPSIPEYSRGFFCNEENEKGCSAELTHKLSCTVHDYSYFVGQSLPPPEFQYFSNAAKGGPRQADYCPVYGSAYNSQPIEKLDCRNPSNGGSLNVYR